MACSENFSQPFYATINQHVWQFRYEIDFGNIFIGTKGIGEGAARTRAPHFQGGGGHKWVCVPSLFVTELRHWELTVRQNLHFFYQYRCNLFCIQCFA